MPSIRVTQGILVQRTGINLQAQMRKLLELQEQLATGQKINAPSQGPIQARRAISARSGVDENEQFLSNITSVSPYLLESVSSIETSLGAMQRAYELALQGANGTYDQLQLDQIAIEIDELLESVVVSANHQVNGRFIFGGTHTGADPFEVVRNAQNEITSVTYVGNGELIKAPVANGVMVNTNIPGDEAFMNSQDIFQTLIDLRDNLRAGDQASIQTTRLVELRNVEGQFLSSMARVGSVQNRVERLTQELESFNIQLTEVRSDMLDVDFAETMVNLNAQSNAFQAALNATARVIQPSLLDFVR